MRCWRAKRVQRWDADDPRQVMPPTVLQSAQQVVSQFPTASILAGVGAFLGGLWLMTRAIVTRIVAAFDGMVDRVQTHEAEDMRRFGDIEARANTRHEAQMEAITRNANAYADVWGQLQVEHALFRERVTLVMDSLREKGR